MSRSDHTRSSIPAVIAGCGGRLRPGYPQTKREVGYFWSEALGWPLVWDQDEETAIRAPGGTGPFIAWGPPLAPKIGKNRLHLTSLHPATLIIERKSTAS